jgi:hypothetical protein
VVVPIEALVHLKLKSGRLQDLADIVGLVKAGVDLDKVTAYLTQHAPELTAKWRSAVATARAEEAAEQYGGPRALLRHQHVRRLQVAVDDPPLVRVLDAFGRPRAPGRGA